MSDPEPYEVYAIQYCNRSNRSKSETFMVPGQVADFHDVAQDITYYVWLIANANRTVLGLGCSTEGDVLGLSPGKSEEPDDWSHA